MVELIRLLEFDFSFQPHAQMNIYYVNLISCYSLLFPLRAKEEIEYSDFMFFLTGGVGLQNTVANPDPSWLQDKSWDETCRASELPGLQGIK